MEKLRLAHSEADAAKESAVMEPAVVAVAFAVASATMVVTSAVFDAAVQWCLEMVLTAEVAVAAARQMKRAGKWLVAATEAERK